MNNIVLTSIQMQLQKLKMSVLLFTLLFFSNAVLAIDIAQSPLFIDKSATPNIMFIMDDSGSMDWDILVEPHFEAYNYDRDANRMWARGSTLNNQYRNLGLRSVGDIVSYPGVCYDRNVDGICANKLDLNGNGSNTEVEKAGTGGQSATYNWHLILYHRYHWNFPSGYCKPPAAGGSDARDFLPRLDDVLAFLSGSKKAVAHSYTGTNWPSVAPYAGMTDAAYAAEYWQEIPGSRTYILSSSEAAEKAVCDAKTDGSTWKANSVGQTLIHQGTNPWVSAGTIANPTSSSPGYTPGVVGNYHIEQAYNTGQPFIAAAGSLDINGNGVVEGGYRENDTESNKRIGYEYLTRHSDNVYYSSNTGATCNNGSGFYNSPLACHHLRYTEYPNNYAFDALAPAVATSAYYPGNENFLVLPTNVPRMIQPIWSNPPSAIGRRFDTITWAPWSDPARGIINRTTPVGTRHALNKWDAWPLVTDWRFRSSALNVMYYNPMLDYKAWPGLADTTANAFKQLSGEFIRSNPQPGSAGYTIAHNLLRKHGVEEGGFVYEVWHDDAGFWSSRPQWHNVGSPQNKCGVPYTGASPGVNSTTGGAYGWKASYYDGKYGPTVRSKVLGVVDPATGGVVTSNSHLCSTYNDEPNGIVDLWDTRDRVTVYSDRVVVQTVRRTPHIFGEQIGSSATDRALMSDTRVSATVTYNAGVTYPVDGFCETVLGVDPSSPANCKTVEQVQENVGTWFEYSRRRSFVAKGAIANLMAEIPEVNYGLMGTSRNDSVANNKINAVDLNTDISKLFLDIYDGTGSGNGDADRTVHNNNIRSALYNHVFRKSGTPLRQALQRAGEYFAGRGPDFSVVTSDSDDDHSNSPITESCQKNFSIMLTDGYWSGLAPDATGALASLNNADGDPYTKTLADVAKYYYDEDLAPTLADDVPTDSFDTNPAQHMTTVGVGFGVKGSLTDTNGNGWPGNVVGSSLTESSNWGNPNTNPRKIDDLWHAAYNSRGNYYKASNPTELINQLRSAILTALATAGSGSALSTNTNVLTASTRVYQTLFTSGEWTGDVKSFSFTASGLVNSTPEWSAQPLLDGVAAGSRKIFTLDVSDAGIPFRWASLSAPSQQDLLRTRWSDSTLQSATFGQAQLDYIRGQNDPQFRPRAHKLGDIVHSEPLYVGTPRGLYADADYLSFKVAQQALNSGSGRTPLIFVGANDGMLHAFDAATGAEKYAYIPKVLLSEINALSHKPITGQDFLHRYYVDQTPVSGDVKIISNWKTVLVGGLGAGGKGIYALDITTVPSGATNETAIAGAKAMWEFTTADDIDMGYSFSKPSIVRLNDGSFAAIFGNGYNSTNNKAVLYVVDIADGSIIKKFETAVGNSGNQNGMSTPTVVDIDGDLKVDRIYAGDFLGNVWTIDISDSSTLNWKFSYNTLADSNNSSLAKTPLFTATDGSSNVQPITSKIAISEHPLGALAGYILNFGTGKYLGTSDNTDVGQTTQTMYGIWDAGVAGVTRSDLVQQTIDKDLVNATTNTAIRVTSANGPVNWMQVGHNVGDSGWEAFTDQKGWRMDLVNIDGGNTDNYGERVVTKMAVRNGAIILSTLLPAANPCDGGGSGWLMTLNASTGARFSDSPFDVNGDGLFNVNDFADIDGDGTGDTAVSGVKSSSGIPSIPTILHRPGGSSIALTDNSSGTLSTDNGTALTGTFGGPTVSSNTCSVVGGTGTCGMLPNGTCQMTGGTGSCVVNGSCPGACGLNGFSEIGRQSWIQLE